MSLQNNARVTTGITLTKEQLEGFTEFKVELHPQSTETANNNQFYYNSDTISGGTYGSINGTITIPTVTNYLFIGASGSTDPNNSKPFGLKVTLS